MWIQHISHTTAVNILINEIQNNFRNKLKLTHFPKNKIIHKNGGHRGYLVPMRLSKTFLADILCVKVRSKIF